MKIKCIECELVQEDVRDPELIVTPCIKCGSLFGIYEQEEEE